MTAGTNDDEAVIVPGASSCSNSYSASAMEASAPAPVARPWRPGPAMILALVAAVAALAVATSGAAAAEAAEEERGADLLSAIERGDSTCGDLRGGEFMAIGEFAMGRMLGSPEAHEGMDRMMASMMGEGDLDRMHEAMGVRFSGCGNPGFPGSFGGMMGMMRMMGGGSAAAGMMGGDGFDTDTDWDGHMDWDGGWWIAMAIGMILFWGLVILGVVWLVRGLSHSREARRPGSEPDAMAILERRLASGEISADEYRERRAVLRGE